MNTNIDMLGGYLGSEEVIKCYQGNTVVWEQSSGSPIDYLSMPLTFEIQSDGYINWICTGTSSAQRTIQYSKNEGEWTNLKTTSSGARIDVVSGDTVQFRGNNSSYSHSTYYSASFKDTTSSFKIYGNIMSLINSTDFSNLNTLQGSRTFKNLFSNCTGLTDVSNLILPATTLADNCYREMFSNCTSLATAPELPATTLTSNCYYGMFLGCTNLTTAPELPATTLVQYCYWNMFQSCTNLNYIKCLATNVEINNTSYTSNWVNGVAASGTFIKADNITGWTTGNNGIPNNWTVLEE